MVASIYIPYIAPSLYPSFAIHKIKYTFESLNLGTVSHVLLEPLVEDGTDEHDSVAHKAYVYFSTWNSGNVAACNIAARLARKEEAKIVYADPYAWTLLPCSALVTASTAAHPCLGESS